MNEAEFKDKVDALLNERIYDDLHVLDLGRRFREICAEYLKSHDSLPVGFDGLDC